jgi:hypothetical protein
MQKDKGQRKLKKKTKNWVQEARRKENKNGLK